MTGRSILIDGYNLGLEKGTGVATYARNLSFELGNLGHSVSVLYGHAVAPSRDPLLREVSFFDGGTATRGRALDLLGQSLHALRAPLARRAAEIPVTGRVLTGSFDGRLPHYDRILNATDVFRRAQSGFRLWNRLGSVEPPQKPDLAHWTYPLPIRVRGVPNIYTLHDIVPLRLPYTTLDNKRHYLSLLRSLQKSADHIVTVSESSKRDLVEVLGIEPERVTVTYQSVEIPAALRGKPEEQVAREVESLVQVGYKDYFLFWGSIEPKKNIGRMLEAYLTSDVATPLVIVGAQAWMADRELQLLKRVGKARGGMNSLSSGKRIIQIPYAPFSMLVSLIRGARAALFPSLYEGFGLPALEAMTLGTPVITSNTASLPEIVGEAAITIDPYDVSALAGAIGRLDADQDLRGELSCLGLSRAERFSPSAYRERLAALYRRF